MNMCMVLDEPSGRVLVQRKVHPRWPGITFPGGHVEDGESVYESTVREVREETGLIVRNLQQTGLIHMFNPESGERRMIFLYKTSHFEGQLVQESPEGKVYWADMQTLAHMQLAPNMRAYLEVFLHEDVLEAYYTPGADGANDLTYFRHERV